MGARGAPMLTPSTEPTATLSLDPAASPLPGPLLSATVARPPSTVPAPTMPTERGALSLSTATATDLLALLPTPVSPPPLLPGLPMVPTVLSDATDTTSARGALMPMPTTATALESTTTTSIPATTATTTPTLCPDVPSPP